MATTGLKLRTATLVQEVAALKERVAALEQHCADKEAVDALAAARKRAKRDERRRERVQERLEVARRNARWKAIDAFNLQYFDARDPGFAAFKRERLAALNAHLVARGMEPEPLR
jgi:hypothetical protein